MKMVTLKRQEISVKATLSTLWMPFAKLTKNVYDVHAKSTATIALVTQ